VIDGTAARPAQVRRFLDAYAQLMLDRGTPGPIMGRAG
jgi:hypothetical protein